MCNDQSMSDNEPKTAYREHVRDFDHTQFAYLPSHEKLREALAEVASETEGVALEVFLDAARDWASTTPYGDSCTECHTVRYPHRVERTDNWITGTYRCSTCNREWTCGYNVDISAWI